ncbi:MAG: hypothetical protein ACLRMG_01135 [Clostridium sp.]
MRNIDILRVMPVEDLAEFLVRLDIKSTANILAGNLVWESPSKKHFEYKDDAIDDCVKWLNKEIGE